MGWITWTNNLVSKQSSFHTIRFYHERICEKQCLCQENLWFETPKRENHWSSSKMLCHTWAKNNTILTAAGLHRVLTMRSFNVWMYTLWLPPHFLNLIAVSYFILQKVTNFEWNPLHWQWQALHMMSLQNVMHVQTKTWKVVEHEQHAES